MTEIRKFRPKELIHNNLQSFAEEAEEDFCKQYGKNARALRGMRNIFLRERLSNLYALIAKK